MSSGPEALSGVSIQPALHLSLKGVNSEQLRWELWDLYQKNGGPGKILSERQFAELDVPGTYENHCKRAVACYLIQFQGYPRFIAIFEIRYKGAYWCRLIHCPDNLTQNDITIRHHASEATAPKSFEESAPRITKDIQYIRKHQMHPRSTGMAPRGVVSTTQKKVTPVYPTGGLGAWKGGNLGGGGKQGGGGNLGGGGRRRNLGGGTGGNGTEKNQEGKTTEKEKKTLDKLQFLFIELLSSNTVFETSIKRYAPGKNEMRLAMTGHYWKSMDIVDRFEKAIARIGQTPATIRLNSEFLNAKDKMIQLRNAMTERLYKETRDFSAMKKAFAKYDERSKDPEDPDLIYKISWLRLLGGLLAKDGVSEDEINLRDKLLNDVNHPVSMNKTVDFYPQISVALVLHTLVINLYRIMEEISELKASSKSHFTPNATPEEGYFKKVVNLLTWSSIPEEAKNNEAQKQEALKHIKEVKDDILPNLLSKCYTLMLDALVGTVRAVKEYENDPSDQNWEVFLDAMVEVNGSICGNTKYQEITTALKKHFFGDSWDAFQFEILNIKSMKSKRLSKTWANNYRNRLYTLMEKLKPEKEEKSIVYYAKNALSLLKSGVSMFFSGLATDEKKQEASEIDKDMTNQKQIVDRLMQEVTGIKQETDKLFRELEEESKSGRYPGYYDAVEQTKEQLDFAIKGTFFGVGDLSIGSENRRVNGLLDLLENYRKELESEPMKHKFLEIYTDSREKGSPAEYRKQEVDKLLTAKLIGIGGENLYDKVIELKGEFDELTNMDPANFVSEGKFALDMFNEYVVDEAIEWAEKQKGNETIEGLLQEQLELMTQKQDFNSNEQKKENIFESPDSTNSANLDEKTRELQDRIHTLVTRIKDIDNQITVIYKATLKRAREWAKGRDESVALELAEKEEQVQQMDDEEFDPEETEALLKRIKDLKFELAALYVNFAGKDETRKMQLEAANKNLDEEENKMAEYGDDVIEWANTSNNSDKKKYKAYLKSKSTFDSLGEPGYDIEDLKSFDAYIKARTSLISAKKQIVKSYHGKVTKMINEINKLDGIRTELDQQLYKDVSVWASTGENINAKELHDNIEKAKDTLGVPVDINSSFTEVAAYLTELRTYNDNALALIAAHEKRDKGPTEEEIQRRDEVKQILATLGEKYEGFWGVRADAINWATTAEEESVAKTAYDNYATVLARYEMLKGKIESTDGIPGQDILEKLRELEKELPAVIDVFTNAYNNRQPPEDDDPSKKDKPPTGRKRVGKFINNTKEFKVDTDLDEPEGVTLKNVEVDMGVLNKKFVSSRSRTGNAVRPALEDEHKPGFQFIDKDYNGVRTKLANFLNTLTEKEFAWSFPNKGSVVDETRPFSRVYNAYKEGKDSDSNPDLSDINLNHMSIEKENKEFTMTYVYFDLSSDTGKTKLQKFADNFYNQGGNNQYFLGDDIIVNYFDSPYDSDIGIGTIKQDASGMLFIVLSICATHSESDDFKIGNSYVRIDKDGQLNAEDVEWFKFALGYATTYAETVYNQETKPSQWFFEIPVTLTANAPVKERGGEFNDVYRRYLGLPAFMLEAGWAPCQGYSPDEGSTYKGRSEIFTANGDTFSLKGGEFWEKNDVTLTVATPPDDDVVDINPYFAGAFLFAKPAVNLVGKAERVVRKNSEDETAGKTESKRTTGPSRRSRGGRRNRK